MSVKRQNRLRSRISLSTAIQTTASSKPPDSACSISTKLVVCSTPKTQFKHRARAVLTSSLVRLVRILLPILGRFIHPQANDAVVVACLLVVVSMQKDLIPWGSAGDQPLTFQTKIITTETVHVRPIWGNFSALNPFSTCLVLSELRVSAFPKLCHPSTIRIPTAHPTRSCCAARGCSSGQLAGCIALLP